MALQIAKDAPETQGTSFNSRNYLQRLMTDSPHPPPGAPHKGGRRRSDWLRFHVVISQPHHRLPVTACHSLDWIKGISQRRVGPYLPS
ncbi:jg4811 [Pararge aegeria aegeria]|uniref:Jg4811 protein n=1 Tax=Pararge aegeria aegeria TaxID=348720 RepID=A0A8S4SAY9_9NEOP|nr:jg4811 [Pararge aegeria aegeria]